MKCSKERNSDFNFEMRASMEGLLLSVKTGELLGEVLGERRGDTFLVSEHGGRGKDDHVNGN